ncbi:ABC transporter substrate-binding protein [Rhodopseudomonas telluris]|uniref:Thiamine pyrimidine synthase n=1 Tax=Rhodopseudomonas telluris TaxID=644215 RepID=A0ABV6EVV2_9BRAD
MLAVAALLGSGWLILRPESAPPRREIVTPHVAKRSDSAPSALLIDGRLGPRFAGEIVAQRRGLFPRKFEVSAEPNAPDFVASVVRRGGIGVTTGVRFLSAAWSGAPITAFAASLLETPTVILTLESSGLRRPSDLIDKKIGYRRGSEDDLVVDAMLTQLGLPRSRIGKVDGANSIAALRAGTVDAIISSIDRLPQPSDPDFVRTNRIAPPDFGIHIPGLVYFTSNTVLREHRAEVLCILEALIDGWKFVYADSARSVPLVVGSDPTHLQDGRVRYDLEQQRDLVLPTGGRIGDYDDSRWRTLRDVLIFAMLGDETVPLPQSVDYQLLRDAYRRVRDAASAAATRKAEGVDLLHSTPSVAE